MKLQINQMQKWNTRRQMNVKWVVFEALTQNVEFFVIVRVKSAGKALRRCLTYLLS
jgi:hypothetical protein